jgi:L-asparaginase
VAASEDAKGYGVVVVISGRVFGVLDVTKAHTYLLDAFESPGLGPVGVIDDGGVVFRRALPPAPLVLVPPAPALPIDIVAAYAGADGRLLDAAREVALGVVVAAMGRRNVPPAMVPGIEHCLTAGKPVVIASRSLRGGVGGGDVG